MRRICSALFALLILGVTVSQAADRSKYAVKPAAAAPPKEVAAAIQALLADQAVQVLDDQGKLYCEVWLRKDYPVKATADEVKKGVSVRKFDEGTVIAVLRLAQPWQSFRKQSLKPGVYTLRLGFQPMDGDHQGTAPFNEFLLVCPAAADKKAAPPEQKELWELSGKAIPGGSHPVVLLLHPNPKAEAGPNLVNKGNDLWVLNLKGTASAGGDKGPLGIGLTLFGVTTAE